jgi:hypothetical protein
MKQSGQRSGPQRVQVKVPEKTCTWWLANKQNPNLPLCKDGEKCRFKHGHSNDQQVVRPAVRPVVQPVPETKPKKECSCPEYYGNMGWNEFCSIHGVCEFWLRGSCKHGDACTGAHQKYSTQCKYGASCQRGDACWYQHPVQQVVQPTVQPTHIGWLHFQLAHPTATESNYLQQFVQVEEPVEKVSSHCWQCKNLFKADPSGGDYWCSDDCRIEYEDY